MSKSFAYKNKGLSIVLFLLVISILVVPLGAFSESEEIQDVHIEGKVYTFDKDNPYEFSKGSFSDRSTSDAVETYGTFSIAGTEANLEPAEPKDGVPAFDVSTGHVAIRYTYSNHLNTVPDEEWHVVEDGNSKVNIIGGSIMMILLQISEMKMKNTAICLRKKNLKNT